MSLPPGQLLVPLGWQGRSINSLPVESTFCGASSMCTEKQDSRFFGGYCGRKASLNYLSNNSAAWLSYASAETLKS